MGGWERAVGVVRTVESGSIEVRVPLADASGSRGSGCAACGLCGGDPVRHLDMVVPVVSGASPPVPGGRVAVEYRRRDPGAAALFFFLPPLVGLFCGGYALVRIVGEGDGAFLAGTLAGFAAGALLSLCSGRLIPGLVRPEARLLDGEGGA